MAGMSDALATETLDGRFWTGIAVPGTLTLFDDTTQSALEAAAEDFETSDASEHSRHRKGGRFETGATIHATTGSAERGCADDRRRHVLASGTDETQARIAATVEESFS
jgi:hypothetical protein